MTQGMDGLMDGLLLDYYDYSHEMGHFLIPDLKHQ